MNTLNSFLETLARDSAQAAVLVGLVLLIQRLLGNRLTPRWRCALWLLVMIRLLLPVSVGSVSSVFNLFPNWASPSSYHQIAGQEIQSSSFQTITSQPKVLPSSQQVGETTPEVAPTFTANRQPTISQPSKIEIKSSAPVPFKISWQRILFIVWLAGVLFLSAYVLVSSCRMGWRFSKLKPLTDSNLLALLQESSARLGVRTSLSVSECPDIATPALYGFFKPRLLLPMGFAGRFSGKELRFILLHELAHVKRHDILLNWLVAVLQIVHWFNPAIWFGFAHWRADRELACDALALEAAGAGQNKDYGQTILRLLENFTRQATIPSLAGILEDKNQLHRRIKMIAGFSPGKKFGLVSLSLFLGLALVCLTDAQSEKPVTNGPNLTGIVQTTNGLPVQATVFIYTAGPRTGTSPFCPSCYADCQKSDKADTGGNFKIKSLDPQLIFKILAVAPGYKPKFVSKVDPAKGPVKIKLQPIEMALAPPGNCLHGRVVDNSGKPIVDAVVEAHGLRTFNGGGEWGTLANVDPLAVTDEKGEFLITSLKPFDMMDVKVSARTFANKTFTRLTSGAEEHQLALAEGATITGRILFNGKPLPNVEVGIVSVDRGMENFTGNFETGTAADGKFSFINMPPGVDYYIYGTMGTLAPYGAIPAQVIHSGKDGDTTDVGDLAVTSGHTLAGRVILADGKDLPRKTRLLVSREKAWDSLQISLPPDGRFYITNVPSETYSLSLRLDGYRPSAKNASLDTLNPFELIGRVDGDALNINFLLENGKSLAPNYDNNTPEEEWPQNRPLHGTEAQPDHSAQWMVSGHVTDAQTGEPIQNFKITPGEENLTWQQFHWNESSAAEGTNGDFSVYVSKRWSQPVLKVEADGYLPASTLLTPLEQTKADFVLQKGNGPSGVVLLPDGKPAADADVLLICDDSQQPNLNYDGHFGSWRQQNLLTKTDASGHFTMAPQLGMRSIAAANSVGYGQVSMAFLATNPVITLGTYGEISGTLERPSGPGTNEDLDVAFAAQDPINQKINLSNSSHTDAAGHFHFDHVPPGSLQISYRIPMSENGWQNSPLQQVTLEPGQALNLNIKAAARESSPQNNFGHGPPAPVRVAGVEIKGTVVLPNGQPAHDVQVGLEVEGQFMQLGRAVLVSYQGWQDGLLVHTSPGGLFTLPMFQGAKMVIAVSDDGFARVPLDDVKNSHQITLQPWARIEGTLRTGHHPGTNETVVLDPAPQLAKGTDKWMPNPLFYDGSAFQAKTDDQGRFVITYVPPGDQIIAKLVPEGGGWMHQKLSSIEVKPGKIIKIELGGHGRTVIGKVEMPKTNTPADWQNQYASLTSSFGLIDRIWRAKTQQERMAIIRSKEYQTAMANTHEYSFGLSADGSFKVEDVLPGKYGLNMNFFQRAYMGQPPATMTYVTSTREFVVPVPLNASDDSPVDLGTIKVKSVTVPTFMEAPTNTVKTARN